MISLENDNGVTLPRKDAKTGGRRLTTPDEPLGPHGNLPLDEGFARGFVKLVPSLFDVVRKRHERSTWEMLGYLARNSILAHGGASHGLPFLMKG